MVHEEELDLDLGGTPPDQQQQQQAAGAPGSGAGGDVASAAQGAPPLEQQQGQQETVVVRITVVHVALGVLAGVIAMLVAAFAFALRQPATRERLRGALTFK